jgi:hypothetical protein
VSVTSHLFLFDLTAPHHHCPPWRIRTTRSSQSSQRSTKAMTALPPPLNGSCSIGKRQYSQTTPAKTLQVSIYCTPTDPAADRRHAAQTVHLWLTKLRDLPSPKRLNMIYLANGKPRGPHMPLLLCAWAQSRQEAIADCRLLQQRSCSNPKPDTRRTSSKRFHPS